MSETQSPQIGETWSVQHSRKGDFCLEITSMDAEWVTGVITDGSAHYMSDFDKKSGEPITIRRSMTTFKERQPMTEGQDQ